MPTTTDNSTGFIPSLDLSHLPSLGDIFGNGMSAYSHSDLPGSGTVNSISSAMSNLQGYVADIENWLVRGGLIIIGGIVIAIALWALLKDKTSLA